MSRGRHTSLLIIGAGPFGIAAAAYAKHHAIDHVVLGKSMDFWRSHMPVGMHLRSGCDWHLDPMSVHTIERYLATRKLRPTDVEPLTLARYLDYAAWFVEEKGLETDPRFVTRLDRVDGEDYRFEALLEDGATITSDHVLVALGFGYFKNVPDEIARLLPEASYTHTCDLADLDALRGKRCLIVGGRQSAIEWGAMLHESGAAAVHICHRHPTPTFETSDWSWLTPIVDRISEDPRWFRRLSSAEREDINRRLWAEGRMKVEPWLKSRVRKDTITFRPNTQISACTIASSGEIEVRLDPGDTLTVDHVVFATGYKVRIEQVPFLARGNVLDRIRVRNGYPVLDEHLQSDLKGLFFTSMLATQDCGPFFAFTVAAPLSARLLGMALGDSFSGVT